MGMQTVVIASSRAGPASVFARRLAADGAQLAILGDAALRTFASDLVTLGARSILAIPCDVLRVDEVTVAAQRVRAELGDIDRWINVAMTDFGYVCCTRVALEAMRERDRGTIVQVSPPRAVRGFTEGLHEELRLAGSKLVLETVRTQPFRKAGAVAMAGAAIVGAALLRRVGRS